MNSLDKKISDFKKFCADYFKENNRLPSIAETTVNGYLKDFIRRQWGTYANFESELRKEKPNIFADAFIGNFQKTVDPKVKNFVVSSVISGAKVNKPFLKSIETFNKKNKSQLLLQVVRSATQINKSLTVDKNLMNNPILLDSTNLNSNLSLSNIELSATNVNPLTGISRLGQRSHSLVVPATKQFMKVVPTNRNSAIPHIVMTAGTVSNPEYVAHKDRNKKTAILAENDHCYGGIIVEVEDSCFFHYRHFQAGKDGSFCDLNTQYLPNNTVKTIRPEALVLGDWHSGHTEKNLKAATLKLIEKLKPKRLVLHDVFNGHSINHHEAEIPLQRAAAINRGDPILLEDEIKTLRYDLEVFLKLASKIDCQIYIVASNHDGWLDSYIKDMKRLSNDAHNIEFCANLIKPVIQGYSALPLAVGITNPRLHWLKRDDDLIVAGVQLGSHGDIGSNGNRKGTIGGAESAFGNIMDGHSHTPEILRKAFRVGTSTARREPYTLGPSSWMQTHGIVHADGSKQLINFINNSFYKGF